MDDELWSTDRQTERLRAMRVDGTALWNDSASVAINAGWLDPHDQLATSVIAESRSQTTSLDLARREEREAESQAQIAAARASDASSWLLQLDEAVDRARAASDEAGAISEAADRTTNAASADTATATAALRSAT